MTRLALHILFFFSGAAALGYQLVWAKMFSTGLGHEMPAVLAIIAAFMTGMALGAAVIDRFVPRDTRAGLWLCGLELTIGLWALIASFVIPQVNDLALRLIGLAPGAGRQWIISFAAPMVTLLPATVAMGATFPAMEKFLSALAPEKSSIGGVYGANTLGAVAGTLLAPFGLMPALGFSKSCWALAAVNGVVSVATFGLSRTQRNISLAPQRGEGRGEGWERRTTPDTDETMRRTTPRSHSLSPLRGEGGRKRAPLPFGRMVWTLFSTGLLGIAYETAGVRVLTQVLEGTVFTYAAVLAIFLLGTAAGAFSFHRWWREIEPARLLTRLLCLTSAASLLSVGVMGKTAVIYRFARGLGDSTPAVLAAELVTALAVFSIPTFLMGALFSHLVQQARFSCGQIGRVVAGNTLGAAIGPVLSVALLPVMGSRLALIGIGAGYFALCLKLPRTRFALAAILAAGIAIGTNLHIVDVPPGGRILSYREGVMASVAVLADTNDQRTLRVDNRFQMGGTAAADAEYRQSHLPLLLHPNPRRVLFLGIGTGISLGAASLYPQIKADAVELVPEVVDALPYFESKNFSAARLPNFKLHTADARRFVRGTDQQYDVIIADLFHPYRDGAGTLYTHEHFAAVRQRLATNGLFCQWLPLHQLDEPTLRVIVRTFQNVFPNCEAWLLRFNVEVPVVALVGWTGPPRWSPLQVEPRLKSALLGTELKRLALADSLRLYGHMLADTDNLIQFAGNAPLNTDDNQRVTFMAPSAAYQHTAKPYASLLALLAASQTEHVAEVHLLPSADPEFTVRLSRYLAARNIYLNGLVQNAEQRRDAAIDAFVESARLSADFTSGYAQCVTIASVIAPSDPVRARSILERLVEAQPERPVAKQMLERLFPK